MICSYHPCIIVAVYVRYCCLDTQGLLLRSIVCKIVEMQNCIKIIAFNVLQNQQNNWHTLLIVWITLFAKEIASVMSKIWIGRLHKQLLYFVVFKSKNIYYLDMVLAICSKFKSSSIHSPAKIGILDNLNSFTTTTIKNTSKILIWIVD